MRTAALRQNARAKDIETGMRNDKPKGRRAESYDAGIATFCALHIVLAELAPPDRHWCV